VLVFSLRIFHPPRSTLFPYTTLFRSKTEKCFIQNRFVYLKVSGGKPTFLTPRLSELRVFYSLKDLQTSVCITSGIISRSGRRARSEEHTSELQSLAYLVCRLLLEKKK